MKKQIIINKHKKNKVKIDLNVSLLHEYLIQKGGAEKVFDCFLEIFEGSDIYTLMHDKNEFSNINSYVTFLQYLPFKKNYKFLLPFFPFAVRTIKIKNANIILSSSHGYIKNLEKLKSCIHFCYCHTPIRYVWEDRNEYVKNESIILRPLIKLLIVYLRIWDKNKTKNVDFFIANSNNVKERIQKHLGRDSIVIPPPVETNLFIPTQQPSKDYYLIASRLVEYKKVDIAIQAFKSLKNKKLVIVGSGRDEFKLKKSAKGCENIKFTGYVNEKDIIKFYQNAIAFIHPQYEDAGIAAVEAQSCGVPVIAFGKGGALETVIEGKTGHFFYEQTAESIIGGINEFEKMTINPAEPRNNALKYDKEIFKRKIKKYIEKQFLKHSEK